MNMWLKLHHCPVGRVSQTTFHKLFAPYLVPLYIFTKGVGLNEHTDEDFIGVSRGIKIMNKWRDHVTGFELRGKTS